MCCVFNISCSEYYGVVFHVFVPDRDLPLTKKIIDHARLIKRRSSKRLASKRTEMALVLIEDFLTAAAIKFLWTARGNFSKAFIALLCVFVQETITIFQKRNSV